MDVEIFYSDGDSIQQSQQILRQVQNTVADRPDAIILEPVGALALPQVARAAIAAGISWVVLNREGECEIYGRGLNSSSPAY